MAGINNTAIVDVHAVAEPFAVGIVVSFPIKLLQPVPGQVRQSFAHFVVSDKQPRSIDFAEYGYKITQYYQKNV